MTEERDWFAILRGELEAEPPQPPLSASEVDTLITDIVSGRIQPPTKLGPRRSGRRWIAGGTAVVLLAGGATAAALWNRTKPTHPEQGIGCHATAQAVGDVAVLPPAADPLDACTQLWLSGALPDISNGGPATDVAPPLFACVGRGGGLDVFPNLSDPPTTCADLGLVDADTNVINDPTVVLQDRLAHDINLVCVDIATAQRLIHSALADIGLNDWTITVRDGTTGCVFAGEDPDTKSVFLLTNPTQTTTT